jgi:hypothetical protein
VIVLLLGTNPAVAHALGAECRLRGNKVEVEAFFDDDTPAQDAKVTVTDAQRQVIARGRTDEEGRWSFPAPQPGDYLVLVEAGGGHSAKVKMTVPATGSVDEAAVPISDGLSRREFTRFPLGRVGLGLAIIGAGGLAAWFVLRRRKQVGEEAGGRG